MSPYQDDSDAFVAAIAIDVAIVCHGERFRSRCSNLRLGFLTKNKRTWVFCFVCLLCVFVFFPLAPKIGRFRIHTFPHGRPRRDFFGSEKKHLFYFFFVLQVSGSFSLCSGWEKTRPKPLRQIVTRFIHFNNTRHPVTFSNELAEKLLKIQEKKYRFKCQNGCLTYESRSAVIRICFQRICPWKILGNTLNNVEFFLSGHYWNDGAFFGT